MNEEENEEIAENIKEYFEGISEFLGFASIFLRYLSSGDIESTDDVVKNYNDYEEMIEEMKKQING